MARRSVPVESFTVAAMHLMPGGGWHMQPISRAVAPFVSVAGVWLRSLFD
jgi:hypothetical protein